MKQMNDNLSDRSEVLLGMVLTISIYKTGRSGPQVIVYVNFKLLE